MKINFKFPRLGLAALGIAAALAGILATTPAFADLIYTLNYDDCTGGCGNGQGTSNNNFGSVDLHQISSNTVSVTVTLAESVGIDVDFVNTGNGSNHVPFAFNVASPPGPVTIVAGSIVGGTCAGGPCFAVGPTNDTLAGVTGTFTNTINCTANCPSGASGADILGGTLVFSTTDGTALSINNFVANAAGFLFAADVIGPTGKTGEVGATGLGINQQCTGDSCTSVPEPTSLALLGTALVGLGALGRRRNRRNAV